jgi:hypothetical protein
VKRNDDGLYEDSVRCGFDPHGLRNAAARARGFPDAAHIDHANATDGPIEWDMACSADDDVGRIVADEGIDLGVGHVVREWFRRIGGRSMDEKQFPAVFQSQARVSRKSTQALQDQLSERVSGRAHAIQSLALVLASWVQRGGIEHSHGAVGQALDHHGTGRREASPRLERFGTRKYDVSRYQELVKAPPLRGREYGAKSVEVTVNIRNAEEKHR